MCLGSFFKLGMVSCGPGVESHSGFPSRPSLLTGEPVPKKPKKRCVARGAWRFHVLEEVVIAEAAHGEAARRGTPYTPKKDQHGPLSFG